MHEKMANRPTGDQKFTIIAKSINDINPKATIDSDVFKDIDDPEVISVALLSEAVNDSVHELGHNVYDYTNWESLADDYATRHGAGPWLARMLDQVYSQSFNISGRPLPVFLLFEALKIFSLIIPPLGILLIQGWKKEDKPANEADLQTIEWFGNQMNKTIAEIEDQFSKFRISDALHLIYKLIWDDFCAWAALATSYSTNNLPMIPMYMYYSMFGFQRIGDIAWAAGDAQAQGFLLGATAGRTTLNGEGLQHQDGHSHILANTIPNCVSYDPCFGYELAVIVHDGLQRMYVNQERVFYYLTVMNENYEHPAMPEGAEEGIKRGMYLFEKDEKATVQLLGSGVILREVIKAAKILRDEYQIHSNVWSVTSFNELSRDGMACEEYYRIQREVIK
jgi:hypothetical protein